MSTTAAPERRRLTTILAADVCRYAALSEADGEGTLDAVEALTTRVQEVVEAQDGRLFHRAGDGFLAELPSATAALKAARALQASLSSHPILADGHGLCLRIGLHTGEARVAGPDLLGHAVNVAARLQGEAKPCGIVLSEATRILCEPGVPMRRMGELKLKNLREPVTAYEVTPRTGLGGQVAALLHLGWVRRNKGPLSAAVVLVLLVNAYLLQDVVRRGHAERAEAAAAERLAAIEENARILAERLAEAEGQSGAVAREATEAAALSLLRSDEPLKAEATQLAVSGDLLGAAHALRAVYERQAAEGSPREVLAETALQVGALSFARDQALAGWAYERAYEARPRDPVVLLRLAAIGIDQGRPEDARAALVALLGTSPEARYAVEAELLLGSLARDDRRFEEAERRYRRALLVARDTNLAQQEGAALASLGSLAFMRLAEAEGDDAFAGRQALGTEAKLFLERALRIARTTQDTELASSVLGTLGNVANALDHTEEAARYYEERLALEQDEGDRQAVASVAFNLAGLAAKRGDRAARDRYAALALDAAEAGRIDGMIGYLVMARAGYAVEDGDPAAACRLLAENADHLPSDEPSLAEMRAFMLPGLDCRAP